MPERVVSEPQVSLPGEQQATLIRRLASGNAAVLLARNTVVSCLVFGFNLALLWLFVEQLSLEELRAAAAAFLIANSLQYLFGRAWIFRGTERAAFSGFIYFLINAVIGFMITMALYAIFIRYTSLDYITARVLVSLFAGFTVFLLNAVFNFRIL